MRLGMQLIMWFWATSVAACSVAFGYLTEPAVIQNVMAGQTINDNVQYLVDASGTLSPQQVWEQRSAFVPFGPHVPSFGYSKNTYWFLVTFKNPFPETAPFLLDMEYATLDDFRLYYPDNLAEKSCGDQIAFQTRTVTNRRCLFEISLKPFQEQSFLMRAYSTGSVQIPLKIWDKKSFDQRDHEEQILFGFYYGSMIIMAIYNLFIFFAITDINYLFYTLFVCFVALFQLIMNGLAYEILWPNAPRLNNIMLPLSLAFVCFSVARFSNGFLQSKQRLPILYKSMSVLQIVALAIVSSNFILPYRFNIQAGALTTIFGATLLTIGGSIIWLKGYRPARFYVLAWGPLLIAAVFTVLRNFNIIPVHFLNTHTVQIGTTLNTLLLSMALADKIHFLREEKEEAQRRSAQHQAFLQLSLERLLDSAREISEARHKVQAAQITCKHLLTYTRASPRTNAFVTFCASQEESSQNETYLLCDDGYIKEYSQILRLKNPNNFEDLMKYLADQSQTFLSKKLQLFVPFYCNNKKSGFIWFEHFDGNILLPEEKKFADTLSLLLGSAIENIAFFNSLKQKAVTDAELSAARSVQQSLLPEHEQLVTPHVEIAAALRPAHETGGDWFHYSLDPAGKVLSLFVGDVTGHGISSALVTGVASGAISGGEYISQTYLSQNPIDDRLLAAARCVNYALFRNARRSQRFMTMAMISMDTVTGELAFINAAHVHPIVLKKDGKAFSFLSSGSRLGFFENPDFKVRKIKLDPGDFVFVYTDGLTENENFKKDVFSAKALPGALKGITGPKLALEHLLGRAEAYWKNAPPSDDVTIVTLLWKGNADTKS